MFTRFLVAVAIVTCLIAPARAADAPATGPAAPPKNRPNVLFIAIDDLRPELGCYGMPIKSPHLDSLAARGVVFNRAYCQQAVCSPSRTSLLTGRRPDTTRVYDLETHFRTTIPNVVTLPQHFKDNGYHTQSFGKIYHGGLDDAESWSVPHTATRAPAYGSAQINDDIRRRGADLAQQGGRNKGPAWEAADVADNALPDGQTADHAIAALRNVKDKPFFLAVGFVKPHLPFVAPKKYFDLYPPVEKFELAAHRAPPKNAPPLAVTNFAELRGYTDVPKRDAAITDRQARELRRAYYASATYMDAQVGRLLKELDKLGLKDNTIVIAWGDHGWHLGDLGQWCKHTNFEVATRVPLIVSAHGMKHAGSRTDGFTEFVDIYPSLCDLAGLPPPDGLEGTSFAPLLNDPTRPWKRAAFSQYPRPGKQAMGYSIRTEKWRYTEWQQRDNPSEILARELYNHDIDPNETENVAADPANDQTIKELSAAIKSGWRAAVPQ